ncbi:MAG: DUF86 domain-containing protein [Bacteroidales bacterium]|nr:DUF86 domain-containing protein [Bacteroidales bacterium]
MREPSRDKGRLQDIVTAAEYLNEFTKSVSYENFLTDKLRFFAILKNVEIIGEAAYMLSFDFKKTYDTIPWDSIIKMRHVLVHGYANVLPEILWNAATIEVPLLKLKVDEIMKTI